MARVLMIIFGLAAAAGLAVGSYFAYKWYEARQFTDPNAPPAFFDLAEIPVSVIRGGQVEQVISFVLTIETREGIPQRRALEARPHLLSLYITTLNALADRSGPENIFNSAYVADQLTKRSNEVIGPNIVKQVLIKAINTRPNNRGPETAG